MKLRITLLVLLVTLTLTAVQYGLAAGPVQQNAATATPTPASAGDSELEDEHAETLPEDITDQAMLIGEPGQAFQVTIATYLLDTAGFHEIDERINQEGVIDPGDAGVVNRVKRVLAVTSWPADLQPQVDSLRDTLNQYAEALANDDVEAAKPLATQVHELQHDLSHAVEGWLGGISSVDEHDAELPGEEHDESEEGGD